MFLRALFEYSLTLTDISAKMINFTDKIKNKKQKNDFSSFH